MDVTEIFKLFSIYASSCPHSASPAFLVSLPPYLLTLSCYIVESCLKPHSQGHSSDLKDFNWAKKEEAKVLGKKCSSKRTVRLSKSICK